MKFTVGPIKVKVFAEAYHALSTTEESRRHPWSSLEKATEKPDGMYVVGNMPEDDPTYTIEDRMATLVSRVGRFATLTFDQ